MKIDIKEDVSKLTSINKLSVDRLFNKVDWCICDGVEECLLASESQLEADLGYGTLIVNLEDNKIRYKFIPSKELEQAVINTVINEKNLLKSEIESTLVAKITNIYKELL